MPFHEKCGKISNGCLLATPGRSLVCIDFVWHSFCSFYLKLWVTYGHNDLLYILDTFCPKHFISVLSKEKAVLPSGNERGFLSWLDISVGSLVSQFNTRMGRLSIMAQNPANAVICLGHSKGVVTMWTPTVKDEAVMKILAHRQPLTSLAGVVTDTILLTRIAFGWPTC